MKIKAFNNRYLHTYRFFIKTVIKCKTCKLLTEKITFNYIFKFNFVVILFLNSSTLRKLRNLRILETYPPIGFFILYCWVQNDDKKLDR